MNSVILQAQQGGGFGPLLLMGGMFVIMYFFMIRPQMKKMKEAKKFQEAVQIGDKVVTVGGIHGKVVEVGEKDIVMALDQGRMRVEKAALSADKTVSEGAQK
ncbi:MAG: preprotein translocase subunit YajC [Flavobacteriales bacterium]|jgi:preprotein translocase subunit YajC